MKRVEKGRFYNQIFLLPAVGIKTGFERIEEETESREYRYIAFAFLKRGISIRLFETRSSKDERSV